MPELTSRQKAAGRTLGGGRTDAGTNPSAGASSQTPKKTAKPNAARATALARVTSHAARHRTPPQLPASVARQCPIIHREREQSIERSGLGERAELDLIVL